MSNQRRARRKLSPASGLNYHKTQMGVFSAVDEVGIHILVPFNQKNPTEEQKLAQQATLLNQVTVIRHCLPITVGLSLSGTHIDHVARTTDQGIVITNNEGVLSANKFELKAEENLEQEDYFPSLTEAVVKFTEYTLAKTSAFTQKETGDN